MTKKTESAHQDGFEELDFSGLILGFSSAALSYMGIVSIPNATAPVNLDLARQNINIIELLHQKTKGNLTSDEAKLTDQVLSDLRLKFVEVLKSQKK